MTIIVVIIAGAAALALFVAIATGSTFLGWFTVGASVVGLLLLALEELRQRERKHVEPDVALSLPRPTEFNEPADEQRSVATDNVHDEEALRPVIWPPEHPVREPPTDRDRVESRRPREGEALRPDIWP
jgi:hypothetical protein